MEATTKEQKPSNIPPMPANADHWLWNAAYAAALVAFPTQNTSGAKVARMARAIWAAHHGRTSLAAANA